MNTADYYKIREEIGPEQVQLLAVSKTKSPQQIQTLYDLGQRDFGENYVQELVDKQAALPRDIRWHFIGHLQSNKVKQIAPFVYLIQAVDSLKLLIEIDKQAKKIQREISCLLQVHIATEETKFGFGEAELPELVQVIPKLRKENKLTHIRIGGLMGMASLTGNEKQIRNEFTRLKILFDQLKITLPEDPVLTLSMGMSSDYGIAVQEGSTMIRIGTALFGDRSHDRG